MEKDETCPMCLGLGVSRFVDFDEDEHFPTEFKELTLVQYIDDLHDLRQCPKCGTYYDCTYKTDNDIFQPTHTGEYTRIPQAEAEKMMREEQARLEKHKKVNKM